MPTRSTRRIDPVWEMAISRHAAGDRLEARRLYHEVLAAAPDHADAAFRAGLLELEDARPESALALTERAAAAFPNEPRYLLAMGHSLQALGRSGDAVAAYRRALAANPRCADGQFALGAALQSLGLYDAAIGAYGEAAALQADFFAAFNNIGNCQQRCGRFAEAESAYRQALDRRPHEPGAMANLGSVLQALGRIDEAIFLLKSAVELEPQVDAHAINLGIALCRGRDFVAAEEILRQVLTRDSGSADAAFNLGNALFGLGRSREAGDCYRQAAAVRPGHVDALINLGNLHQEAGDFAAAQSAYEAAIRAAPSCVAAVNNAACLLRRLGRLDAAEDMLRRGLELDGTHPTLHDNLGSVLKDSGDLDAGIASFRKAVELEPGDAAAHSNLAYAICFQSTEPAAILEESLRWDRRFAAPLWARTVTHANEPSPLRRLRIGYVSPDFRNHCQTLFTSPLLASHDHAAFEIFCYASVARPDGDTRRLAAFADVWRDVHRLDDAALADLVRSDGIDILVDLTMHMANGRPLTFARKPAPIQIAWLGYPGTTGLGAMDYRLTDARLDPPGVDDHYSERSIRLPDSFWCYDPLSNEPPVNELPALDRGHVTFGCLNNPCKLTDATLRLWSSVMRVVPDSRLLLLAQDARHRLRLTHRLAAQGIAPARLEFVPYRGRAEYLRTYHEIDIGLDTFPYNGHTTSLDSLWMGVPVITRVGDTCVGRGGFSQLFQLGLTEYVADTDQSFVDVAVAASRDLARLAQLRQQLRTRLERSPLMDASRFARAMETAYRGTWLDYCAARTHPAPR